MPTLALFDYSSAFTSVFHCWLFRVLESSGWPDGFINFVRSIYTDAFAYVSVDGQIQLMCRILRGVLQGCPLSGTLFDLAVEPILRAFVELVQATGKGIVRVCADDIAAVLRWAEDLGILHGIFSKAQWASGLVLKLEKCILFHFIPGHRCMSFQGTAMCCRLFLLSGVVFRCAEQQSIWASGLAPRQVCGSGASRVVSGEAEQGTSPACNWAPLTLPMCTILGALPYLRMWRSSSVCPNAFLIMRCTC